MKIAFIGLGIMGSRMAKNLAKENLDLTIYNRTRSAAEELVNLGALLATSAAEAVKEADVVFTMLSTPGVVQDIAFGTAGFVKHMKKNALWVDCTTVDPGFTRDMAAKTRSFGVRFMDAPVAGSKVPAEKGELVFLVGGAAHDMQEAQTFFDIMGSKTIHAGDTGMGTSLKMLVNSLLAQAMAIFAESVVLGEKMGFSRDFLLGFLSSLPVTAPFLKTKADKIKSNDYSVEFPLEWMQKDLHLLGLTAYDNGVPQYMASVAREIYTAAKAEGLAREDFSAIIKSLEKRAK